MKVPIPSVFLVHVFLRGGPQKQSVGRLALQDRQIVFEYSPEFLKTNLNLSPWKLPLKPGLILSDATCFEGLFGLFNDSLPDGWGRLLLDRRLIQRGIHPSQLSPLDRLCYVGSHGMGALSYEPEIAAEGAQHTALIEQFDQIAAQTWHIQNASDASNMDELITLLSLSGSSTGARPKIMMRYQEVDWLVKFRSLFDPIDIGPIEYAYHLMAKAAQLDVPEARLFPSKNSPGYFGVQRFDRSAQYQCFHMHTMSGLLHADHRLPALTYETILQVTAQLTRDTQESEKQFRAAAFNVLAHNRDDHAKNFSFVMDLQGRWKVSPAYDLTFSVGPGGEHCALIQGEGKNPTRQHLLKLAASSQIPPQKAGEVLERVRDAIARWPEYASIAGVSKRSSRLILKALEAVQVRF